MHRNMTVTFLSGLLLLICVVSISSRRTRHSGRKWYEEGSCFRVCKSPGSIELLSQRGCDNLEVLLGQWKAHELSDGGRSHEPRWSGRVVSSPGSAGHVTLGKSLCWASVFSPKRDYNTTSLDGLWGGLEQIMHTEPLILWLARSRGPFPSFFVSLTIGKVSKQSRLDKERCVKRSG